MGRFSGRAPRLLSLRPQLLRSVPDDPLELLDTLHHLGHRACAVNQLADLRVRKLVRSDERDEADGFPRSFGVSAPCGVKSRYRRWYTVAVKPVPAE